ncbi:MAG: hypothetical protein Aureis2KO_01450 [Aureisphaera sp.]
MRKLIIRNGKELLGYWVTTKEPPNLWDIVSIPKGKPTEAKFGLFFLPKEVPLLCEAVAPGNRGIVPTLLQPEGVIVRFLDDLTLV